MQSCRVERSVDIFGLTGAMERQRLGLGQWPAVGLAEARARARKAREVLDEGIDPRKARIVKGASARTESPLRHAPGSVSHTVSAEPAIGTTANPISNIGRHVRICRTIRITSPKMYIRYSCSRTSSITDTWSRSASEDARRTRAEVSNCLTRSSAVARR